jgi:hypothetical protein
MVLSGAIVFLDAMVLFVAGRFLVELRSFLDFLREFDFLPEFDKILRFVAHPPVVGNHGLAEQSPLKTD